LIDISTTDSIARVIQLSIAPVFLLTAIGTLLTVMTNRLHRVIDRARFLESKHSQEHSEAEIDRLNHNLANLSRRAKLIGTAITLCTAAALFVCTLIATLFLESFVTLDIKTPVAVLFILVMLLLIVGLIIFLREIFVATYSLRIGPH
jgi:CBS domain containing-hemolysin-like protein